MINIRYELLILDSNNGNHFELLVFAILETICVQTNKLWLI